jgi:hypothetical protein
VLGQWFFHGRRKHRVPILISFAGSNENLVADEIDVFNPDLQTFHQSEPRSVKEHNHEPIATAAGWPA